MALALENAQAISAHQNPQATKLCDPIGDKVTFEEVEQTGI